MQRTLSQQQLAGGRVGSAGAASLRRSAVAPFRSGAGVQQQQAAAPRVAVVAAAAVKKAAAPASGASPTGNTEAEYDVYLDKPLGIKFGRGRDGGAYIVRSDAKLGNTDPRIAVGDKVIKISASFGGDVWEALNFGQVVYAVKTRNGQVYLRLRNNFGDMTALEEEEMTDSERQFKAERAGGNVGVGTKETQARNYVAKKEAERKRRELFDDALFKFKAKKIEDALIDFENVLAMEPKNYLGDDFARVTQVYRVTQYNIACCYSSLRQPEAGLEALNAALAAGFEDYAKARKDPNLAELRKSPKFGKLLDKYDEPIINEGAIRALKSLFSFGKGNDDE